MIKNKNQSVCNAFLIDHRSIHGMDTNWTCVGVQMDDVEEGKFGDRERVCHYQDICTILELMFHPPDVPWLEASKAPVIHGKLYKKIKVKVV